MKNYNINTSPRARLLALLVEWIKPFYRFFLTNKRVPWRISYHQLQVFPQDSLGKDLALFLQKENLHLMPLFEDHDVMHTLLGYKNTVLEEAQMQFFLLGNGKRSFFVFGACALAVLLLPEYTRQFSMHYKKGRAALSLAKWDFQHLLYEPTQLLRNLLYRNPCTHRPFVL